METCFQSGGGCWVSSTNSRYARTAYFAFVHVERIYVDRTDGLFIGVGMGGIAAHFKRSFRNQHHPYRGRRFVFFVSFKRVLSIATTAEHRNGETAYYH